MFRGQHWLQSVTAARQNLQEKWSPMLSTCGHMWKLVLNPCLERLGVILRQTNPAVSTLHQSERECEWMRLLIEVVKL